MSAKTAAASPELLPTPAPGNPPCNAVTCCAKAWQRTYELASIDPESDDLPPGHDGYDEFASEQAAIAFRSAMPPLSGYANICDFIACVTHGLLNKIFYADECERLFRAAKIALSALRNAPQSNPPIRD